MNERTVEHFYKNGWRKLTVVHISEVMQELNKKDCQISKLERRIKELESQLPKWHIVENGDLQELKRGAEQEKEIEQLRKENAKLKCLALHGMFGYACTKMNVLSEEYEKEFASGMVHKDFSRWHRLARLWHEAYRKAKKELKEGK